MDIGEELDKLAAEGRVSNVTLAGRTNGGWQCYLKLGLVNEYVARCGATPSVALAAALADLPKTEAYELKFGAAAVTARALAEKADVEREAATESTGIFD